MEETFKEPLIGISKTLDDTSKVLLDEMDRMNEQSYSVTSATEEVSHRFRQSLINL